MRPDIFENEETIGRESFIAKASRIKQARHENRAPDKGAGKSTGLGGSRREKKDYPLHVHISLVYSILIIILLSVIGVFNHLEDKKNLSSATQQMFMRISGEIKTKVRHLQDISTDAIDYLYESPMIESGDFAGRIKQVPFIGTILRLHPELSSVAIGYADGSFFRLGRVKNGENAGPGIEKARYLIRNYESEKENQEFIYLDHDFDILGRRETPHDGYDPRKREWYRQAIAADKTISTKPYYFISSESIGKSVARRSKNSDMVVSISFPLSGIDRIFDSIKPTGSSRLLVFDGEDKVLYDSQIDLAIKETPLDEDSLFELFELDYPPSATAAVKEKIASASYDTPFTVKMHGKEFIFAVTRLMDTTVGGMEYYVVISSPKAEVLPTSIDLIGRQGMFMLLALCIAVPVSWFFSKRLSRDLVKLSVVAEDTRNFSFSFDNPRYSSVSEFNKLSESIFHTNRTLKRFLEINSAISIERDYDKLLDTVLSETMGTVDASAGILYLMSDDRKKLAPCAARCPAAPAGGVSDAASSKRGKLSRGFLESLAQVEITGGESPPYLSEAVNGIPQMKQIFRDDWPSELMRKSFREPQMQLISVPLVTNRKTMGVLCLYRRDGQDESSGEMLSFINQLSGGAAVAIENHNLIEEQKRLFEALIRLLAGAIDSKSRYTGGHCQRVPVIAEILAAAVGAAEDGTFADFHIDDEQDALRVASWLHDCGKIITPEHVVDKATKLETIYNRIHEIRTRFEVMKRDAEISCCRSILRGEDEHAATKRMSAKQKELDDDFAFLAKCNIGDEMTTPEQIERIESISRRTWQRTISDRLGISEAERKRMEEHPEAALPATERLLADKPEHLIEKDEISWLASGNKFGFKFDPPKYKYNLGEIANLSITWGTLTAEERYQINNHVMQTIIMLSHLPFPEEYGDIVEIAGNHHERVDGNGYPRRIGREDMSVEARIIAIADVFEALTASDRPYKKAKKLSEALSIMSNMARTGHLDPDLFNIFIASGAYRKYACRYLEPSQIDGVDEKDLILG